MGLIGRKVDSFTGTLRDLLTALIPRVIVLLS